MAFRSVPNARHIVLTGISFPSKLYMSHLRGIICISNIIVVVLHSSYLDSFISLERGLLFRYHDLHANIHF